MRAAAFFGFAAALLSAPSAWAFCRTTTCNPNDPKQACEIADNGDMLYHVYNTKGDPAKKTAFEVWKIVNATGAHKGTTGSGSCNGKLNDDGTSDWECTGTISTKK